MNFEKFKLNARILSGIQALGYKSPTPIQEQAIPPILEGLDVIGLAQTGTGKTAAFILPLLQRLMDGHKGQIRSLIIVPTRELAEQIHETIQQLGQKTGLRSTTLYGGVNLMKQFQILRRGVDIVIACPGRLLDHIERKNINLNHVEVLILDEADHLFDFGFLPSLRQILKYLPQQRQNLLFSATMPKEIRQLAEEVLHKPVTIQIGKAAPVDTVEQILYPISEALKTELLVKLLQVNPIDSALVFTRTKRRAKQLAEHLGGLGYSATSFQGNLSQSKRQIALTQFRKGRLKILVATDIAARGIDISHISHVINFDMPTTTDAYTHRIGRTGRATKLGAAFTFITNNDRRQIRAIERLLNKRLAECIVPEFNYQAKANTPLLGLTTSDGSRSSRYTKPTHSKRSSPHFNHKKNHPQVS